MPKLNPNEAPEGYVAERMMCNNGSYPCTGCAFNPSDARVNMGCDQPCWEDARKDRCWVIFKRKPTKPTRKPREWMAWAVVGDWPFWNVRDNIYLTRDQAREDVLGGSCGGKVIRVKITEVV